MKWTTVPPKIVSLNNGDDIDVALHVGTGIVARILSAVLVVVICCTHTRTWLSSFCWTSKHLVELANKWLLVLTFISCFGYTFFGLQSPVYSISRDKAFFSWHRQQFRLNEPFTSFFFLVLWIFLGDFGRDIFPCVMSLVRSSIRIHMNIVPITKRLYCSSSERSPLWRCVCVCESVELLCVASSPSRCRYLKIGF